MTSRERVLRCLEFSTPDRIPRDLWVLPRAEIELGQETIREFRNRWPGDIAQASVGRPPPARASGDPTAVGEYTDEWGCVFRNIQAGVMGEVREPILAEWSRLDDLRPPTEFLQVDREAVNAFCRNSDRFVFASGWGRLFERIQFLRGSENVMYDLADEPPEFLELLSRVHGFYRDQYEAWARTEVDALVLMDDWGSQQSLLISPAQWRRIFKPLYAEYVRIAHDAGKKFFMHSDGCIFDIYEDLIEIGVDAINSQLFCMDIGEIGRRFAGRIAFWGEIDRQHVLPFGTVEDVKAAVRRVADALWRPEGGVIAQFEISAGIPMANAEAVYRSWESVEDAGPR